MISAAVSRIEDKAINFAGEALSDDVSEEDPEGILQARGGNGVPKVVFSMQTQNHDGTTYWTVEKHGGNPGKKDTALNPKHEVACQQNFGLSNVKEIKLASYLGVENLPHSLIHDKKNIRRCKHKRTKHSCPSGIRDVIECGSC
ncbi:uncharacterized protein PG998_005699 [Apiospora kogelbergensis]|uniref:uncharacterized protein n=1 Tax=Apiospora kogelbergensis TaxID=1337665 RepID=UPI00312ED643